MPSFRNPADDPDRTALLQLLAACVGTAHVLRGAEAAPFCTDWRGLFTGQALAVLRPGSTAEVAACVELCAARGIAIVPQGGNTGLSGGATPFDGEVVLSLGRLNRVRALDPVNMVLTAEAGVTLQAARDAAVAQNLAFPLSIASEGSAQLGGIVATNAGGTAALRHGSARALVLGLEVVLADGRIWNGLRSLRKDNTGYALAQLFAGSEGTLGIITAATLRLSPAARTTEVALAAIPDLESALQLLGLLRAADEGALAACEYISGAALRLACATMEGLTDPLTEPSPHYVLVALASPGAGATLRDLLEAVMADALEQGAVTDAVIATSDAQRARLWALRENLSETQRRAGVSVKNDIAVPISRIPAFIAEATTACHAIAPATEIYPFGHLGDGNIHFNLTCPDGTSAEVMMHAVGEAARAQGGSFSAEHGIGQLKTGLLAEWRGDVEMDLFRAIKRALDPRGVLNPGKVLAE